MVHTIIMKLQKTLVGTSDITGQVRVYSSQTQKTNGPQEKQLLPLQLCFLRKNLLIKIN